MMRACIELHKVVEAKIYILQLEDRFGYVIVFSPPFKKTTTKTTKIQQKNTKTKQQTNNKTNNKQTNKTTNKQTKHK